LAILPISHKGIDLRIRLQDYLIHLATFSRRAAAKGAGPGDSSMGGANASTQRDLIPADPWQPGPSVLTFLAMARHYEPSPCCVDIGHGHRTDADKDGAGRRLGDGGRGMWMVDVDTGW